ncbi:hypothetical protein SFRURICE_013652 [Spodoptera frugiperda]|nr:hypothetical protein SFRURICE_013652 [Spodoptera frugiperda]
MSRWGRGRGGSVAVPLDSALFRENSNCPTAARSAGTVGKWGITSFTSIRSAPYAYANNILKKPVQDQNSPLTVPAVETEQPPPKPKKFFKSRNAEVYPPVPQITYAPPVPAAPLSPEHPSHSKEKKTTKRSRAYTRDSSSPELPRRNSEKSKSKKGAVATKASRKEDAPAENTQPPNKRYLVRNRDKVINYAEDGSNSPIPEFTRYESSQSKLASPKVPSPKASPLVSSPSVIKPDVTSPSTSKETNEERKPPPIVLRISKGTSRIVSTDSNEGFTSPSSDRHSSLDTHSDVGSDHKKSPSMETICSPKHEGLKITIKCGGLTQETKKEKKKDKKDHKSHKRHHKNSDDEPLKKLSSPQPGTDAYDLYKTLASPSHETEKEIKNKMSPGDDIESQLAKLDSGSVIKSPRLEVQPNELPPEPKPPESSNSGRSRRNRTKINYSENDDYLDVLTAGYPNKQGTKTVSDIKKEGRKTRRKQETLADIASAVTTPEHEQTVEKNEIPMEKNDLIDILSGGSDNTKNEVPKIKIHRKHKHKHNKNSSPDHDVEMPPEYFYTVVRNVKKAHQIQEIGEFQEFNDDVEYLLDALQNNNPISTRCLSAITLASKCTAPAFRMHLRAHGTVQKFFSALHDATNDQSLGLCTATVMFVLSQDRLNMDLDRESLELMLNLLESDASHKNALDDCGLTSAQLTKTQERVRELCAEIKSQGKAQHLDLENITVGHLAMETLLSLTSKRAGEWFKEELRVLGGVDHIVRTIQDCAAKLDRPVASWTSADVEILRKADRCLRVLENVTQANEDNQVYLCSAGGAAARSICFVLRAWIDAAYSHPAHRAPLLDAALPALKVLLNLSHSFGTTVSLGAQVIGEQQSVMETCLIILYNQGNFIPDNRNFEFSVCVLLLLINLVQNNEPNTERLLSVRIRVDNEEDTMSKSIGALDLIVDLFYKREELARRAEENTDALLDGEKEPDDNNDKKKQSQDDIDETVAKLLARAGAHMEHSMVGAYMALLLGHAACCGPRAQRAVRDRVPLYAPLLPTLNKLGIKIKINYVGFWINGNIVPELQAEAAIVAHVKATHRIIKFMEASDKEAAEAEQGAAADVPQDMSLSNLNYSAHSYSSSDTHSSSMELDGYH